MEKAREKTAKAAEAESMGKWLRQNEAAIARRMIELARNHGVRDYKRLSRILRTEPDTLREIMGKINRARSQKK